jgi:hypothetical protein
LFTINTSFELAVNPASNKGRKSKTQKPEIAVARKSVVAKIGGCGRWRICDTFSAWP